MSTEKYMPGRLVLDTNDDLYACLRIDRFGLVARCGLNPEQPNWDELQRANARRLAACWNACDGLPTELIEMADGASKVMDQHRTMLNALQGARRCLAWACEQRPEFAAEYEAADAAIAKATGSAA